MKYLFYKMIDKPLNLSSAGSCILAYFLTLATAALARGARKQYDGGRCLCNFTDRANFSAEWWRYQSLLDISICKY